MKTLNVIGAPPAVTVTYGVIEGDKLRLNASASFFAVADIPTDEATPARVARMAQNLVNMLVVEATKALNPELVEAEAEPPAKEPEPS